MINSHNMMIFWVCVWRCILPVKDKTCAKDTMDSEDVSKLFMVHSTFMIDIFENYFLNLKIKIYNMLLIV